MNKYRKQISTFTTVFLLTVIGVLFYSCSPEEDIPNKPGNEPSTPTEVKVSSITITGSKAVMKTGETLQLTAEVLPADATNKNVLWTSDNSTIASVSSDGLVTANRTGSVTITATSESYRSVSGTYKITVNPDNNDCDYVDLGLSVMWAPCNIGASKPEEYGDYYAWGETGAKSTYDWSTYKWCNGSYNALTKYCSSSSFGKADNVATLELSDDVASQKMGGGWHMPTKAEQEELLTKCKWKWENKGGNAGYTVTGSNGNSIFLPAAGYRIDGDICEAGSYGFYWSSSVDASYSYDAHELFFNSDYFYESATNRSYGQNIRPVCK